MTIDQEKWSRIKAGDEKAREEIIIANYALVQRVAGRMKRRLPEHVELGELVGYGTLGLLRAVEKFDPSMGVHFEMYAAISVRSLIMDELRRTDWAPRSLRRRQREVNEAEDKLLEQLGRQPTQRETADSLGWNAQDVAATVFRTETSYHRSLDEGDPERDWAAGDEQDPQSGKQVDVKGVRTAMEVLMSQIRSMPAMDQLVLALYYYEGLKLAAVGRELGITETRASQIHSRAVIQIREALRDLLGERVDTCLPQGVA